MNGHTEAIRVLIAAHANIEAQDNNQLTPLHLAAEIWTYRSNQNTYFCSFKYRSSRPMINVTPLHQAAINGNIEAIRVLLVAGANIEAQAIISLDPFMCLRLCKRAHRSCATIGSIWRSNKSSR